MDNIDIKQEVDEGSGEDNNIYTLIIKEEPIDDNEETSEVIDAFNSLLIICFKQKLESF